MRLLMISCKKSTYLLSKKEEGRLSWLQNIQLRSHMAICSLCRKFEEQTAFIGRNARNADSHALLSLESKDRMKRVLKETL